MSLPYTYFAIGTTLANMQNVEQTLLTTETIQIVSGQRVPYVGSVALVAVDASLRRDGFKNSSWLINTQAQAELFAYFYTLYGNYTTDSARFYISTLAEDGYYTPYWANVYRPSTVDGTIAVPAVGFWFSPVKITLTDCQLQSASKTGDFSVTTSTRLLYADTSGGSINFTLPAASAPNANTVFSFVKTAAANTLTLTRAGSDTINGATTKTTTALNSRIDLVSDHVSAWTSL